MKQDIQNIVEGKLTFSQMNMMIADFMGTVNLPHGWIAVDGRRYAYQRQHYPGNLRYNSSWSWLMPVIQKIDLVMHDGNLFTESLSADLHLFSSSVDIFSKRERVYKAVIQFIQWYNNQQKQVKE